MKEPDLQPGERLDDLLIDGMKIIQRQDRFRFSLDAVLLAHFATLNAAARVVDLGSGTGAISLLLAARGAAAVLGIEILPELAALANRSASVNDLAPRVRFLHSDYRDASALPDPGRWDLVVANPPYRPPGRGDLSSNAKLAVARHELTASLTDVMAAARRLLRYRGRFAMVHLPERLPEICRVMSDAGIEPKRLRLVTSLPGHRPKLLLVEGVRGAQPGLDIMPELAIYETPGVYAGEILKYYGKG